jgi:oligopeptide transport system ATP-binding protein
MSEKQIFLQVEHLKKYYPIPKGLFQRRQEFVKAVDDISFEIYAGETLGLVGESGCGKTTTSRAILQLDPPTSGSVRLDGRELVNLPAMRLQPLRREMQIIFQNPYSSLNPRLMIGDALTEPMIVHGIANGNDAKDRACELLETVGLNRYFMNRFPSEFSGGQRQRIGIARALSVNPRFIICDEPISSLDVSIQGQIINLLRRLRRERNLTYLFISHDLSMVRYISDRTAIMYLGKIVEIGESKALYANPLHPYAQALWSAAPVPDPEVEATRKRIILEGDVPSPVHPPPGCRFSTRCPRVMDICRQTEPVLKEVQEEHKVACFLY